MIGLVIVTHGGLAREFRAALEHIVGPQEGLETISIGPEDDMVARRREILEAVARTDTGTGVILLTDMFGGTPANLAISILGALYHRALTGRGRVLIHCKGGCGRSGMVALRLMIEAGEAPDEALARLRSVRPCAVETDAQMRWAMSAERGAATFVRHSD